MINEKEKFLSELSKYIESQIKGYERLQKNYNDVTFREIFQTLDSIKNKIEKFNKGNI